jgi:integrase
MAIRKRTWQNNDGSTGHSFVADYRAAGVRHMKAFKLRKDAQAYLDQARQQISQGVHVAPGKSPTVAEATASWLKAAEAEGLERATTLRYEELSRHVVAAIGGMRLREITPPVVRAFENKLREQGKSRAGVRKILGCLGSILAEALDHGLVGHNVVRGRKRRRGHSQEKRDKKKLEVGKDIPTPDEVRRIIDKATGRWKPLLMTAALTGLRASELRGLRWLDVDFPANLVHVRQRADRFNSIGKPKSAAGKRKVPMTPALARTLDRWKLICPRPHADGSREAARQEHLVFPNGAGKIESLANIINRGLIPTQIAAGVVTRDGKAKYTGMHCLRHFYASWLINPEPAGLNLPAKVVQQRLGHTSITMTYDRYGHLFPTDDDSKKLAAAETALLGDQA